MQHASSVYTVSASFTIFLKVEDELGCKHDTSVVYYIDPTIPPPAVNMSANNLGCDTPYQVSFSPNITGVGSYNFVWDFGDGDSSFVQNPSHTYQDTGAYSLKQL